MPARPFRLTLATVGSLAFVSAALHALVAVLVAPFLQGHAEPQKTAPAASSVLVRQVDAPPSPHPHEEPPAPAAASPPTRPTASGPALPQPPSGRPPVYFDTAEVDQPAMPQPDWNIDAAGLATVGVRRLSFEIFVGRDGVPQRCEVLAMEPPLQDAWPSIAAQLCRTKMSPAMRGGEAVANVRRIELETGR